MNDKYYWMVYWCSRGFFIERTVTDHPFLVIKEMNKNSFQFITPEHGPINYTLINWMEISHIDYLMYDQ